ncbi:MAG TPA: AAA family ATPase [Gammaproteobacteria bacterium]
MIVIDEVQRRPGLFPVLRVLVDRASFAGQFLILGSASGDLLRQSSETLAGRMEMLRLRGFSLQELGQKAHQLHWLRGGFPLSYLASSEEDSLAWRKGFIQTLLERDFP